MSDVATQSSNPPVAPNVAGAIPIVGSPDPAAAPAPDPAPVTELALGTVVSHTYDDPRADSGTTTTRGIVLEVVHPVETDSHGDKVTLTHYVVGWFPHLSDPVPGEIFDGS